jgi:putative oxidoreductase
MNNVLGNKYLVLLSRLALGLVFIIASVEKIAVAEAFAVSVDAYQLIPVSLVNIAALLIPWIEFVCGLFLVCGIFVRSSALLLSLSLCVFIVAIISAMIRHLNIDCGCFGSANSSPVGLMRIVEDIGLLLLGIHLFRYPRSYFAMENILFSTQNKEES